MIRRSVLGSLLVLAALPAIAANAPAAKSAPAANIAPAPAPASTAADPLDALVKDSPFLPVAGARGGAVTGDTGPLELRGVVVENGTYSFSVYDQGTKESSWVRIDEQGYPFTAKSYDRANDTLVVDQGGRSLTLALQTARTGTADMAPPQPTALPLVPNAANRPANVNGGGPLPGPANVQPGAANAMNPDEAQRLQRLADEIRRRRNVGSPPNLPRK